jgi:hypothetical protein
LQLAEQPVEPVAHLAELPELARKVSQPSVQIAERAAELVRTRQAPGSVVLDKPPEGHPQTSMVVGPRCKHICWRHGQPPLSQEHPDRDLARKPPLDIGVQHRRAGHHSRDHRGRLEMHEHIAAGSHHHRVLTGDGVGESDRPGRRHGTRDTDHGQKYSTRRATSRPQYDAGHDHRG